MLVDDVNIHVKGCINEVEEMREHIRAKLEDEVGLLQLKMSGTEKEKEGKTNVFLSSMFWECRFQKVGAKKRELESRSLLHTGVPNSRHVARVTNGSGAHEHMGVQKQWASCHRRNCCFTWDVDVCRELLAE